MLFILNSFALKRYLKNHFENAIGAAEKNETAPGGAVRQGMVFVATQNAGRRLGRPTST
jgi:hypothetical protein